MTGGALSRIWIAALVAVLLSAGAAWWLLRAPPAPRVVTPAVVAMPTPVAVAPAKTEPQHPIEAAPAAAAAAAAPAKSATLAQALEGVIGKQRLLTLFNTDDFARRVVATVDNLPREHAPSRLWPVQPTGGRFLVGPQRSDGSYVAADNSARYLPLVQFVESLDMAKVAKLYAQFYPSLQQAYSDLGYPGKSFNDRAVAAIDHLLATPEPSRPLVVTLTQVKGPYKSEKPWVRYEYADPQLEAASAGRKILMRAGQDNARRLKLKLTELRQHLVRAR